MGSKIKIFLLILAYVLNIAHYVYSHEHNGDNLSVTGVQQELEHLHNGSAESEHDKHEFPFNHCHLIQNHDNIQIRNNQPVIYISDIPVTHNTTFCFQPPEILIIEISLRDDSNIQQVFISSSLCLRAPPTFS